MLCYASVWHIAVVYYLVTVFCWNIHHSWIPYEVTSGAIVANFLYHHYWGYRWRHFAPLHCTAAKLCQTPVERCLAIKKFKKIVEAYIKSFTLERGKCRKCQNKQGNFLWLEHKIHIFFPLCDILNLYSFYPWMWCYVIAGKPKYSVRLPWQFIDTRLYTCMEKGTESVLQQ